LFLKFIELQGFKSFPDKTRLTFDKGITAIVGPNGSGKSNLSDSIRWVLGEQSGKSLRGGKMEDVIFGGSAQRKAMGFAQVSLGLDNSDGRIPDVGNELVVSRKYFRSGDSEYLINGKRVRLQDIRETFFDTGLSRNGYSIIEQGRIAAIVSAKSKERRQLFEEASGIAKYRYRKEEAQKKLEAAEDNLSRLRDILDELESRVEPLREQSEKAKKFLELQKERRSLEITLYCDTIERSSKAVNEQEEKLEIASIDYDKAQQEQDDIDEGIEREFERNREISAIVDDNNGKINGITEQLASLEAEKTVRSNEKIRAQTTVQSLENELKTVGDEQDSSDRRRRELNDRMTALTEKSEQIDGELAEIRRLVDELDDMRTRKDVRHGELSAQLMKLTAEQTDLKLSVGSFTAELGQLSARLDAIRAMLPAAEKSVEDGREKNKRLKKELEDNTDELTGNNNQKNGYNLKLASKTEQLENIDARDGQIRSQIDELRHRAHALEETEKSMDGFYPSVKRVMEAGTRRELRGIVGTVAQLISIKSGCEVAIETALGTAIQNIVVENERSAKDAIYFLKKTKAGRATFMPLDTVKGSRFDDEQVLKSDGTVGLASRLVSCDARYESIISGLLGRIIVAEDLDAAANIARACKYRYRVVTLDGQVVNAGGSFTGGFSSRSAGVFSRRSEIERLNSQADELERELLSHSGERKELADEINTLRAELTVIGSEEIKLGVEKIRIETEMTAADNELSGAISTHENMKREADEIEKSIKSRTDGIEQSGKRLDEIAVQIADIESSEDMRDDTELADRRSALSERLTTVRIGKMETQKDIEGVEQSLAELAERQSEKLSRRQAIDDEIKSLNELCLRIDEEQKLSQVKAEELTEQREALRRGTEAVIAERFEHEKEVARLRESQRQTIARKEELGREKARLEERRDMLRRDFDQAVAKLWEDYELTRNEAVRQCVEFTSVSALRQNVASLRGKIRALGSVNVGAIDEYAEVSQRYEFLSEQVNDVDSSKKQLLDMIKSVTAEMRTIFTDSFAQIADNFSRAFADMFGGGTARISLSEDEDVLESGIEIDVQPPGKIINNLAALSGGEQALVAIALYFAILAVNPSPFCVLDEIDSALDDVNVDRFARYMSHLTDNTQVLAITHRRGSMEVADTLWGVTMQEEGVSKLLKLTVSEAKLVVGN